MVYNLKPNTKHIEKFNIMHKEKQHIKYKAVFALLLGSFFTSIGFILRKIGFDSHESGMIRTNVGALIISLIMFIKTQKMPDLRKEVWLKLLIFNILIGYVISKFRSLAFNSVPEIYYAIFVFLGSVIAYKISDYMPHLKHTEAEDFHSQ